MRLTPWEVERLLIFSAAELARRHRAAGLKLNAPEAIALMCDAMLESARAGAAYEEVEAAGRAAVGPDDVVAGVRELVDEVRLEVLLGDGTRLVVLLDPLGGDRAAAADLERGGTGPGAIRPASAQDGRPEPPDRLVVELDVRSESRRVIHVSSHFPFHRVNARLQFDRDKTRGYRLDLPSGAFERWAPGQTKTVRLVRFCGESGGDAGEDRS